MKRKRRRAIGEFQRYLGMANAAHGANATDELSATGDIIDFMAVVSRPPARHALRPTELAVVRASMALGCDQFGGPLTLAEQTLLAWVNSADDSGQDASENLRTEILEGGDPLGEELLRIRPGPERRSAGAFYTPASIVGPMVDWALGRCPSRVVDAGCGSGRFAVAVARQQPDLPIIAVDLDPVATLITRANLAVLGATHTRVIQADYTELALEPIDGRTAFIGNPPYVRHHELSPKLKSWAAAAGQRLGHPVSSLSGLHTYFFLATALLAESGDFGTFITSSEWLDVGYGSSIRELLLDGLGGLALVAFDPRSSAFEDVMTTAVIVSFEAGAHPKEMRLARVKSADELPNPHLGHPVARSVLQLTSRWSSLLEVPAPANLTPTPIIAPIPLGRIAEVHRGQVTGGNRFYVMTKERAKELGIEAWCRPAITAAEEVLDAGGVIYNTPERKVLFCPPRVFDQRKHPALTRYLALAEQAQIDGLSIPERYVPRHRSPWWHLGKIPAPPIVASYMARRAPAFALNPDRLALLNIAHGLWPRAALSEGEMSELVAQLNTLAAGFRGGGRTYHGGLEKFEPREMEALLVSDGERWVR